LLIRGNYCDVCSDPCGSPKQFPDGVLRKEEIPQFSHFLAKLRQGETVHLAERYVRRSGSVSMDELLGCDHGEGNIAVAAQHK